MRAFTRRNVLTALAALAGAVALGRGMPARAGSVEMVMFRRAGCPWCHTWDREIGAIWPKSDIGSRHAMRMVDLDADPMPEIALDRPVRFTPTFVVAVDGAEIGRIEGYPGQDFFWGLMERLAAQAEGAAPPVVN
ncbi:thioredoxin family protein [Salinarimonas sp.]|uniref:thioredoxin family protein n=1 Tax=Salinarimonas sp. TaxID=2766526 RepID=UPI0032D96BE9